MASAHSHDHSHSRPAHGHDAHPQHGAHHLSPEALKAHIRKYVIIGVVLLVATGLTVAASQLPLSGNGHVVVALIIAIVKASLVAAVFMHLLSERGLIFSVLGITALFFFVLLLLPLFTVEEVRGHLDIQTPPAAHHADSPEQGHGEAKADSHGASEAGGH